MDRVSYTELNVQDIERGSSSFQCPCCNAYLQFKVGVKVHGVFVQDLDDSKSTALEKEKEQLKAELQPQEIALLDEVRSNGTLQAFKAAVIASRPQGTPKDMERYFITFLRCATKKRTPQFALRQCLPEEERAGDLELWIAQSVGAVIADNELRTFIPLQLVDGKDLPPSLGIDETQVRPANSKSNLTEWVRTKNGYVVGRGLLFNELRGRAAGQFATTGI